MSNHDDIQHLNPDQLLTGFSRTPFLLAFLLSIFVHVMFLGLFSMTPLLNMILPQAEVATVVEEKEVVASEPEESLGPAPASTGAQDEPPREVTPTEPEETEDESSEKAENDPDDFDIDLDVLNH
ncbi:MAG: hypothetical protein EA401_09590 [Planctomycetota bacterium]|nr:MAG: hypothetical protein EA401_09590 [Planctomycetota bacterium]